MADWSASVPFDQVGTAPRRPSSTWGRPDWEANAYNPSGSGLPENSYYEGVSVQVHFASPGPTFGDLFLICGEVHRNFPPTGRYPFADLDRLQFVQVDDYFGVRTSSGEGDDVVTWLYPVIDGEAVHHHPGPFDAVELAYCVLRHPTYRIEQYLDCVASFSAMAVSTRYVNRDTDLGTPTDLGILRDDIGAVVDYWSIRGITVGSDAALMVDY